jgi:hypothetical protein
MSKKDKIFIIWIIIAVIFSALCAFTGGIIICFNKLVGLILSVIGVGGMLLCVIMPYITYCIGGLIKLMKEEE